MPAVAIIHIFARIFEVRLGGHGGDDLKCFVSISRIVVPVWAGSTFSKKSWNKWSENEKWSRKTLDGKCDGYMWGLGEAKKRKC